MRPLPAVPLHDAIQRSLRQRIEAGEFVEGDRLPSEAELQSAFHASRTPVRQALRRLQLEGVIVRSQGRGSFVSSAKIGAALRDLVSFTDDLRRRGYHVSSRTLAVEETIAPGDLPRELEWRGRTLIHVRRVISVDGEPLALFDHWLSALKLDQVVKAGDMPSLYALMERHGFEPWYGTETIGATTADDEVAALLGCPVSSPLMVMKRLARDITRCPVEYTVYLVRADRYEYQVNIVRQRR